MKDVQSEKDSRGLTLNAVGISGLAWPVTVKSLEGTNQHTAAVFQLATRCPAEQKGIHMSRLVEALDLVTATSALDMCALALVICSMSGEDWVNIRAEFDYFSKVFAPASGRPSPLHVRVAEEVALDETGLSRSIEVIVPITTLCPCSKEISDYGAHNQRSSVQITVVPSNEDACPHFEQLIEMAKKSGSAQVYPLVKRCDEREITMQAFDNPKFVEDVVRDLALRLLQREDLYSFHVKCTSIESIHAHQAFAEYSWTRGDGAEEEIENG